jgi:hypothetical protein
MKKSWLLVFISLSLVPSSLALLDNFWNKILFIGDVGWLGITAGSELLAFTRILIWIAIFTIFFGVLTLEEGKKKTFAFLNRGQAMVVAAVLASMSAIFLPGNILAATGAGWATLVSFVLIGIPVMGIAWFLWKIPWEGSETKFTVFLKIVLVLILMWILTVMKHHVVGL